MNRGLKIVGFLSVSKSRKRGPGAAVSHFHPDRGFGLGTCLAEDSESGQCFVVNLSNQKRFAAFIPFPDLSDLNLASGHVYECSHIPGRRQYARPRRILRGNSLWRDTLLVTQTHLLPASLGKLFVGLCHQR